MTRRAVALGALLLTAVVTAPLDSGGGRGAIDRLPRLMLWAWERPVDLRGIRGDVGVAFLAQTLIVSGDRLAVEPRRQPLRVSAETPLMAVTRIEAPAATATGLDARLDEISAAIANTAALPRVSAIQIDFDAALSQRDAYRELIPRVRQRLAAGVPLSITALASWCAGDAWLDGLPIDEAVPMLFQMGREGAVETFEPRHPSCGSAVGTSLAEPIRLPPGRRRVYVFNPRSWSDRTIAAARALR